MTILDGVAEELGLVDATSDYQKGYTSDLEAWIPCAEVEAVNYTPWWGGDYRTYVRDPNTLQVTSFPTSETIKGVLRWVLRAALNAHLDTDIKTLDEVLAPVYGGVRRRDRHEEHLDSLVRIAVEPHIRQDAIARCLYDSSAGSVKIPEFKQAKPDAVVKALQEAIDSACATGSCTESDCRALQDYVKLFNVPRVRLALMRHSGESMDEYRARVLGQLPALPESIHVNIRVGIAKGFEKRVYAHVSPTDICRLTLLALFHALVVHGLGRGSSRGFGRFQVKDVKVYTDGLDDPEGMLKKLSDLIKNDWMKALKGERGEEGLEEAVRQVHEELVNAISALTSPKGSRKSLGRLAAPSFSSSSTIIKVLENASVGDVYDALYVIGCSTLKQQWKNALNLRPLDSGVNVHTWILGLPRWQQETGYTILEEVAGNDLCLPVKTVREKRQDVRRKSVFLMFPSLDPRLLVLVGYKTREDHSKMLELLYHVGAHTDRVPDDCLTERGIEKKKRRKRPAPGDAVCRHAVRLSYAIKADRVGPGKPLDECHKCCGVDPGGVAGVTGVKIDVIERVYRQAERVLPGLLSEGCRPSSTPQQHMQPARRRPRGRPRRGSYRR